MFSLYVMSKLIMVTLITTLEWFNFTPIGPSIGLSVKSCMVSLVSERSSRTAADQVDNPGRQE